MKKYSYLFLCSFFLLLASGVHAQWISTLAGNGTVGYGGDGSLASLAALNYPMGVGTDAAGNVYIADQVNQRIRKVAPSGIITTVAGTGVAGYSGDGGQATNAQLTGPQGVTADIAGNIYFSDPNNNVVRRITPAGIITTIAGTGTPGFGGDGGPATAALLSGPTRIAVNTAGDIYICDVVNHAVRRINPAGIIETIAGNGIAGFSGDGGAATDARLHTPRGVALGAGGEVYIADAVNNRIRMVNSVGDITTYAGTGTASYAGDGGLAVDAALRNPYGVAVSAAGEVYIADANNNRIRRVNAAGIITTFAGTGFGGFAGDGGLPAFAQFSLPVDLAFDTYGNLYINDIDNGRIRKVSPPTTQLVPVASAGAAMQLSPNPAQGSVSVWLASASTGVVSVQVSNITGQVAATVQCALNQPCEVLLPPTPGIYFVTAQTPEGRTSAKLVVQ